MSSWKRWATWSLVGLAAALAIPLSNGRAAAGVYVQPPCESCRTGNCMCYPNVQYWGYFDRQWRPRWPGEKRPDIDDPAGVGRGVIPTPQGAPPVRLPKEEYAEPGTGGLKFQEGPSTGPIAPESPFKLEPEAGGLNVPKIPLVPQEPPPMQLPLEGAPSGAAPGVPPIEGVPPTPPTPPTPTPPDAGTWNAPFGPTAPGGEPERAYAFGPGGPEPPMPAGPPVAAGYTASGQGAATPPATFQENVEPSSPAAPFPSNQAVPQTPMNALPPTADGQIGPQPAPGEPDLTPPQPPRSDAESAPAQPWEAAPGWRTRRNVEAFPAGRRVAYDAPVTDAPLAQAPIGLDGYCPVQLVRSEQWVEGSRQLAVEYEGRTYLISGPAEHRLFRAHPERYAPALGGCDVVLAVDGAGRVAGRTDACVVYEGRLYMFSDQSTLARFRDDPRRFAQPPAAPGY